MKRLILAVIPALMVSFALLFSACAPSPYMIATLTQLPFAATPPTYTPFPTSTSLPTRTPTPGPTIVDGVGISPTSTISPGAPTLDATVAAALTLAAGPTESTPVACASTAYDMTIPNPNTPSNYLFRHYNERNLPQGMRWEGSGMLESNTYRWAHLQVQNQDVYWIEQQICSDATGQPYWEIADAIIIPALNSANEAITSLCFENNQQIPFAIAYGSYDKSKPSGQVVPGYVGWPLQVKDAWQMKEKFIPLNTQGLTCMVQDTQHK